MASKVKIKIVDNNELRKEIDALYEKTSHVDLAKWSLSIAKHIFNSADIDYNVIEAVTHGFMVNELWQSGNARMHDVRQAALQIHKIARESQSEVQKTAFRVAGQAVATGHMKEHAMVASDYAVKVIGLMGSNNTEAITNERKWQLNELKELMCRPCSKNCR